MTWPIALLTGTILFAAPLHVSVSIRVKQYTVEAVLALVVIWLAVRVLERPAETTPWRALTAAGIGTTVVSGLLGVIVGGALAGGAAAVVCRQPRRWRPVTVAASAFAAFAAVWWWLVLRRASSDALRRYWLGSYVNTDEGVAVALRDTGERLIALSGSLSHLSPKVVLGFLAGTALLLLVRRLTLAIVLVSPLVVAWALALAEQAPLGARTDAYLLPPLALLVGAGLHEVGRLGGKRALPVTGIVALAGSLVIASTATPRGPYVAEDVRSAVHRLEQLRQPNDGIVVYPTAGFAYALYTPAEVGIRPSEDYSFGFRPVVHDSAVTILDNHRRSPDRYLPRLRHAVVPYRRVWFLEAHTSGDVPAIEQMLRDLGFSQTREHNFAGARLTLWLPSDGESPLQFLGPPVPRGLGEITVSEPEERRVSSGMNSRTAQKTCLAHQPSIATPSSTRSWPAPVTA